MNLVKNSKAPSRAAIKHAVYVGDLYYSDFRFRQLQQKIEKIFSAPLLTKARTCYFIETQRPLSRKECQLLQRILPDNLSLLETSVVSALWVMPRQGTLSPWSSKARDILKHCGLKNVVRIDLGVQYFFSKPHFSGQEKKKLISALHDPLTESVLWNMKEIKEYFTPPLPKPLGKIPFLAEGKAALINANAVMGLS